VCVYYCSTYYKAVQGIVQKDLKKARHAAKIFRIFRMGHIGGVSCGPCLAFKVDFRNLEVHSQRNEPHSFVLGYITVPAFEPT
jgi:hypothetical protein